MVDDQDASSQNVEAPAECGPQRRLRSSELLAGQRELLIDHEGQVYRLRVTRNGKLILHK